MKKMWICLVLLVCLALPGLAEELRVDFYDVGKADAMLITAPDGAHILIDTGTNKAGKLLTKRFEEAGISSIDLMMITHFDKDHVGGADKILEAFSVEQVILPQYEKDGKQYEQLMEALEDSPETEVIRMQAGEKLSYTFGDASILFSAAEKTDYGVDEENDFSIAARMTYGETKFFFTGDAEDARQTELLLEGDVACDVLKVPYHGRLVDVSAAFLSACHPKIAFIPDSDDDPAHPLIVELLEDMGTDVHSAREGDLVVVSDGQDFLVK